VGRPAFEFIEANQVDFPMTVMCRVLDVSRSGYYDWRERAPSARAVDDEVVVEEIRLVHEQSRQTHGYRRVTAELVDGRHRRLGRRTSVR
jgi:putative transposase